MNTYYTDSHYVTLFVHDGSRHNVPHAIKREHVEKHLRTLEQEAKVVLGKSGADHVVYAVKSYDADGSFVLLDAYMLPLNDDDFYSRTESLQRKRDCRIYALHKMK